MNQIVMDLLHNGLSLLLQVVLLGALAGLIWVRKELKQYIVAHTTLREREFLAQVGKAAFSYAETAHGSLDGPGKLNEALKYMLKVLEDHGMQDVSMETMRAAIEAAWLEDRRASGQPPQKPVPNEVR